MVLPYGNTIAHSCRGGVASKVTVQLLDRRFGILGPLEGKELLFVEVTAFVRPRFLWNTVASAVFQRGDLQDAQQRGPQAPPAALTAARSASRVMTFFTPAF